MELLNEDLMKYEPFTFFFSAVKDENLHSVHVCAHTFCTSRVRSPYYDIT